MCDSPYRFEWDWNLTIISWYTITVLPASHSATSDKTRRIISKVCLRMLQSTYTIHHPVIGRRVILETFFRGWGGMRRIRQKIPYLERGRSDPISRHSPEEQIKSLSPDTAAWRSGTGCNIFWGFYDLPQLPQINAWECSTVPKFVIKWEL
jgi:hypothetical protein